MPIGNSTEFMKYELSVGSEKLFDRLLPQAVLFRLPAPSVMFAKTVNNIIDSAACWRKDGILPYPLTAVEFNFDSELAAKFDAEGMGDPDLTNDNEPFRSTNTVIAWATGDYDLNLLHRIESWSDTDHMLMINRSKLIGTEVQFMNSTPRMNGFPKDIVKIFRHDAYRALIFITYLVNALSSVGHTASNIPITRLQRRSRNFPNICWDVKIRPKNSRSEPSMKSQFSQEVRSAHTVRAHIREEHLRMNPSGKISVVSGSKVQSHVRGRGELFQLKDYSLE